MGYDLHITRAELWFESDQRPISQAEWLALVEHRIDLRPVGSDVVLDVPGGIELLLWWRDGQITVNKPYGRDETLYEPITDALVRLASNVSARLQGDDGEAYELGQDSAQPADTSD
jgi:hypothetical protein